MRGHVARFDDQRGFGWIIPSDGGPDIFVHQSDVRGDRGGYLAKGEIVEFDLKQSLKGPRAVNVKRTTSTSLKTAHPHEQVTGRIDQGEKRRRIGMPPQSRVRSGGALLVSSRSGASDGLGIDPFLERTRQFLSGHSDDLPFSHLELHQERRLVTEIITFARTLRDPRMPRLSTLIANALGSLSPESTYGWRVRYSLLYLHFLCGEVRVTSTNRHIHLDPHSDPVVRAILKSAASGDSARTLSAFVFHDGLGPPIALLLSILGGLGYRLTEVADTPIGFSKLQLKRQEDTAPLPTRCLLFLVYGNVDDPPQKLVDSLAHESRHQSGLARLIAFCPPVDASGNDSPAQRDGRGRVADDCNTIAKRFGAAFCYVDGYATTRTEAWLQEAKRCTQTIENPVAFFPDDARDQGEFIQRPSVVAELKRVLDTSKTPVAIYCMRKAGKTATGKLVAEVFGAAHRIVDVSRWGHDGDTDGETEDAIGLLKAWRKALAPPRKDSLIIIDESDTFWWRLIGLKIDPLPFLYALEDATRSARILMLGLDPEVFPSLAPASNPLQILRTFHLPYFDRDEARRLLELVAGILVVTEEAIDISWQLSGGHPLVMKQLLLQAVDFQFRAKFGARVPRDAEIGFAPELRSLLESPKGAFQRQNALERVLWTRRDERRPSVAEAWRVAEAVARMLPDITTADAIEHVTRGISEVARPFHRIYFQLCEWGLLRERSDGTVAFGIPLLRIHLRYEETGQT